MDSVSVGGVGVDGWCAGSSMNAYVTAPSKMDCARVCNRYRHLIGPLVLSLQYSDVKDSEWPHTNADFSNVWHNEYVFSTGQSFKTRVVADAISFAVFAKDETGSVAHGRRIGSFLV